MTAPTISAIFDQLDRDRHLAGYRLEERASPYFRHFLPEVMARYVTNVDQIIIPEFPFKKEDNTSRSPKVDFFAMSNSKNGQRAFLIELKTDMGSVRDEQDKDLESATDRSLCDILCDIRSIASTPRIKQDRQKYFHLLHALECLELIEMPNQLEEKMYAEDSRGVYDLIGKIVVKTGDLYPEIVHILPVHSDINRSEIITFAQFADEICCQGDFGRRFAHSLRCWADVPAGNVPPGTPCP